MTTFLASIAIVAMGIVTQSAYKQSARKQIEADYALFSKAWQQRDLAWTYGLMTEDFTAVGMDPSGKPIGRKQMIAQTKQLLAADHISWPRKVQSVQIQGKEAVAIVDGHFTGMMPARAGSKPQKFELIAETKDTWMLIDRIWKFKRMEIVRSVLKIDGKPMKR